MCPAGTFNGIEGASSPSSCLPCPKGTYADSPGSSHCILCPAGTFSNHRAQNSSGSCKPCGESLTALQGAATCAELGSLSVSSSGAVTVVRLPVPPPNLSEDITIFAVYICVPLILIAAIPLVCHLFGAIAAVKRVHHRCYYACSSIRGGNARTRRLLKCIDIFSQQHEVEDGTFLIKRQTSSGGALSILAFATMGCVLVVLLLQFVFDNVLTTSALLPTDLPVLLGLAASSTVASIYPSAILLSLVPPINRGILIQVTTREPTCQNPDFVSSALLSGTFAMDSSILQETAITNVACSDCIFGPLSAVTIAYPPHCQSFFVTTTFVGATGSISVAGVTAASSGTLSLGLLSSITISYSPHLELVNNTLEARSVTRGYTLGEVIVSVERKTLPSRVLLVLDLSIDATYTVVTLAKLRTWVDLISAIVGLGGFLGIFGCVFRATKYLRRRRRSLAAYRGLFRVLMTDTLDIRNS
jgi:hypothetical protein